MQIKKLKIHGLYGYINETINFNQDITLLVGINGVGKTSVLNIINWLLKPSIEDLSTTEFNSIELVFLYNNEQYTIICKHSENRLVYDVKTETKTYNPLTIFIHDNPQTAIKNDRTKRERYAKLQPDDDEKETWATLMSFPNPVVIGLDRNIYTEDEKGVFIEDGIKHKMYKNTNNGSPLNHVKLTVSKEYTKQKNKVLNLTNQLKNSLMLSSFETYITLDSLKENINNKLNYKSIANAEIRIRNIFNQSEINSFSHEEREIILKYFEDIKFLMKQIESDPDKMEYRLLFNANANQFIKIQEHLSKFEDFEKKSQEEMKAINNYLATLNYFFKDSGKRLRFNENTSELIFNIIDVNGLIVDENRNRDISNLSSGEQQLLILFSYIAFNNNNGQLFIIDEPELSLHVKWQEDFISQLEKIRPQTAQLLFATHSPILAHNKRDKTIVLQAYK